MIRYHWFSLTKNCSTMNDEKKSCYSCNSESGHCSDCGHYHGDAQCDCIVCLNPDKCAKCNSRVKKDDRGVYTCSKCGHHDGEAQCYCDHCF